MLTRHLYKSNYFKSFVSLREILPFWTLNIDTECLHVILFIYWFFFPQTFEVPTVYEYNHRIRKSKKFEEKYIGRLGWTFSFYVYIITFFYIILQLSWRRLLPGQMLKKHQRLHLQSKIRSWYRQWTVYNVGDSAVFHLEVRARSQCLCYGHGGQRGFL